MKKTMIVLSAMLALLACNKIAPEVVNDDVINASKLVFNITVNNANDTKGVKTAWENGDVVYAFFEDNSSQYVKMTYNGTSWDLTDKDGGSTYTNLSLAESGKKVSAVYFPSFVCSSAPAWSTDKWTFGDVSGYYQTVAADYTATSIADVTTVSATLNLAAPTGITQLLIPNTEYTAPEAGNEYVFTATHISPFTFNGIVPGSVATHSTGTDGFPIAPYEGTIGGETGYYFWGILEGAGTYDFEFQLVKRNAERKYAISSKHKSVKGLTVSASFAAKLTSLNDNGNFVNLGYSGSPFWATGNLNDASPHIADPLDAGSYYMYGSLTPYNNSDVVYKYSTDPLPLEDDAAYRKNTRWRIATKSDFDRLQDGNNTTATWVKGWTHIYGNSAGVLFTSNKNGISLLFAAAGYTYANGYYNYDGSACYYWTATPMNSQYAYKFYAYKGDYDLGMTTSPDERKYGYSIRPVLR